MTASSEVLHEVLVEKPQENSHPETLITATSGGKKRKRRRTKGSKPLVE
jgi:hypothetical protein